MDILLFIEKDCENCAKAEKAVKDAVKFFKDAHVNVYDLGIHNHKLVAMQFKVTSTPSLVVDGTLVYKGVIPSADEVKALIEKKVLAGRGNELRDKSRGWSISGLPEQWGKD